MTDPQDTYRVRLPIFEGPFDLLLHLVKINEMEITDVSLAQLTHQYLEYLDLLKEMDLDIAGEFLVVAATLLQIKARSLLPDEATDEEEEEEIDETLSARELMSQLIEYRSYKEIVAQLHELEEESAGVFYRRRPPQFTDYDAEEDDLHCDMQLLFDAMASVLRYVEKARPHTDFYEKYTVEDKIDYLKARLKEARDLDVVAEFERCLYKIEIIVTFLALLELARLRFIRVEQVAGDASLRVSRADTEVTPAPEPTEEASENEQSVPQEAPSNDGGERGGADDADD